jgi:hypothetical protein
MVEFAWADANRKPVIVPIEAKGSPHDSVYIRGLATYLVKDLGSGIAVARCFFNARPKGIEVFMGLGAEVGDIQTVPINRHF